MNQINNSDRKVAIVCLVIFIAAVAASVMPFIASTDMMRSGYALTCVAGFFAVSALIAALVFFARAAT